MEKYREYRREIKMSQFKEEPTQKELSSKKTKIILDQHANGSMMGYDDVSKSFNIYNIEEETRDKKMTLGKKKRITFIAVCSVIAAALLVVLIILGVLYFGGK